MKGWHQREQLSARVYQKWVYFVSKEKNCILVGSPPRCCLAYRWHNQLLGARLTPDPIYKAIACNIAFARGFADTESLLRTWTSFTGATGVLSPVRVTVAQVGLTWVTLTCVTFCSSSGCFSIFCFRSFRHNARSFVEGGGCEGLFLVPTSWIELLQLGGRLSWSLSIERLILWIKVRANSPHHR